MFFTADGEHAVIPLLVTVDTFAEHPPWAMGDGGIGFVLNGFTVCTPSDTSHLFTALFVGGFGQTPSREVDSAEPR